MFCSPTSSPNRASPHIKLFASKGLTTALRSFLSKAPRRCHCKEIQHLFPTRTNLILPSSCPETPLLPRPSEKSLTLKLVRKSKRSNPSYPTNGPKRLVTLTLLSHSLPISKQNS